MPSKKKKYNARFPAGRIKKIMQTDDEVGKVAQAVPVIISKTLELFVQSLLTKTMQITSAKNAKTLSPSHMKQCILSESRFDFLKDLVKGLPDVSGPDEEVPTPPLTPAPLNINAPNTATSVISPSDIGSQRQAGLSNISIEHKSSKDNGTPEFSNLSADNETVKAASASELTNLSAVNETTKTASVSQVSNFSAVNQTTKAALPQVPKFQISVPTPFQISQLNFYTEVNPVNLSTNPPAVNASNQPTSNFAHTANIDEDYDT